MTDQPPTPAALAPPWWERHRAYLRLIAEIQTDPRLFGKIDLSGVVQQALLEAHRDEAIAPGSEDERLAWLRRVLANNLTDELRKLRSDKRAANREVSLAAALEHSSRRLELFAAEASSPSAPLQRHEQALRLATALERLPEAQREALILQHWHGWKLAEIAEHLGRSRVAVAGLLKRGLQQLRKDLATDESRHPSG